MKTNLRCLLAVLACSVYVLSGCSDSGSTSTTASTTTTATTAATTTATTADVEQTVDTIGKVVEILDAQLTVDTYENPDELDDYASLDTAALTLTGERESVSLEEDAQYYIVADGGYVQAAAEDLSVDSTVVITADEDGVQQIIILEAAQTDDESDIVEGDTVEGETVEDDLTSTPVVAQVVSIAEDGTLTLNIYALTEENAAYEIEDYAAVALEYYAATEELIDYTIAESATVECIAEDGTLRAAEDEDLVVGKMLVICTDENLTDALVIYPAATEDAE